MITLPLTPVPMPMKVALLVLDSVPEPVRQAMTVAEGAERELRAYRPLAWAEDRADREDMLARLARANKVLAAYSPLLVVDGAR
ncbi:hypothetical protein ACFVZH_20615 [Streptomyces sp. NPDC059534]|uniref:hypothetical protein n=1 Tax=Streptomyces sp. NPDC059534 TaxID=3346859 RepID=UPI0036ABBBBC